ncbi:MAG: hypothetical protein K0S16_1634 [Moraxellaceae bacterium]|jgi:hypothetical protein|nr:hypothetical protein [Moraxellaceae bacterium]
MQCVRALPLYVILLAACSEPSPATQHAAGIAPGINCRDECAAGFRWAVERGITDAVKCRGETEYARGCREAVTSMHPFAKS